MSVFDVKAAREARTAKTQDAAADLRSSGHDRSSRAPLIVGASIAAIVLYLKTAYSAHAEAPQQQPDGNPERDEGRSEGVSAPASAAMPQALHSVFRPSDQPAVAGLDEQELAALRRALSEDGLNLASRADFQFTGPDGLKRLLPSLALSKMRAAALANDNETAVGAARRSAASGSSQGVTLPNRAPLVDGPVLLQNGFATMAVLFTLNDLLKGAADPDQDHLSVVNLHASSGDLIPVDDGYMYIGDAAGPVTITYEITDGIHVIPQQASLEVKDHAKTLGTTGDDKIVGSDSGDLIATGPGADTVTAGGAMDTIYADEGDDLIHSGAGNDLIVGGAGNDKLFGDDGNDVIFGGLGNDEIHGGRGNDTAYGDQGNDSVFGEEGNDTLLGNAGNDVLSDGAGQDYVAGGADDDTVLAAADGESDAFDGGAGVDTLSFAATTTGVTIDAVKGMASGGSGSDAFQGFERFQGGSGDDTFIVGKDDTHLAGGDGDDTFDIRVELLPAAAPVRHVIEDFEVGDRVHMSRYDIFENDVSSPDFLSQMNAGDYTEAPDSSVPVKFRMDDASLKTYIEADFDQDNTYEVSVELDGHHNLLLHFNSFA